MNFYDWSSGMILIISRNINSYVWFYVFQCNALVVVVVFIANVSKYMFLNNDQLHDSDLKVSLSAQFDTDFLNTFSWETSDLPIA